MANTNSPAPGSSTKLNQARGYASALIATDDEIRNVNAKIGKAGLVFNMSTNELLISKKDKSLPSELVDHQHPFTHAPLIHSHLTGMNEPWRMGNPVLWYRDDLPNHPELCPLDGRAIPDHAAGHLSTIYPGTVLMTTPVNTLTENGFINDQLSLSVDSFKGSYLPSALFGDPLSVDNFYRVADQWLASSTDLTEHVITLSFNTDYGYRPCQYWMIPAAGTSEAILKVRPTPRDWTLEGSNDGSVWTPIHTVSNYEDWHPCTTEFFNVDILQAYTKFRLRITAWNPGDGDLEPGLRRLWIFGRQANTFHLPNIPSPHQDFVWVVPYDDINVAMLNEDVGDIGTTAIPAENLPHYRIPTDGRYISKEEYPELYAAIGNTYGETNDTFAVPDIENTDVTTYIVSQQVPHDVPFDVIQRLQSNMLSLAKAQSALEQQLNALIMKEGE